MQKDWALAIMLKVSNMIMKYFTPNHSRGCNANSAGTQEHVHHARRLHVVKLVDA